MDFRRVKKERKKERKKESSFHDFHDDYSILAATIYLNIIGLRFSTQILDLERQKSNNGRKSSSPHARVACTTNIWGALNANFVLFNCKQLH